MHRRTALAGSVASALGLASVGCAPRTRVPDRRTRWIVQASEGFDALAFLGPLSGKPFYAQHYESELAAFKPRLSTQTLSALDSLYAEADADGYLLWPRLALIFSGTSHATLEAMSSSLDADPRVLRAPFEASVYWDPVDWNRFRAQRERLSVVLAGLRAAGFSAFRHAQLDRHFATRQARLAGFLGRLDVVAEQERLLGRSLDPLVEVNLLWFCRPHGVKVQGQRFLAHVLSSDDVLVLTAAHENLHPPFDMKGATAKACLAVLERDPLLARILREKSKDSGYNSLEGILDEDTVQALDQIIQERLGFGRPPAQRWTTSDEGMHVLAAGLYGMLKADGYDRSGGNIEAWMASAVAGGRLAPTVLHAAAAQVLGRTVETLWAGAAKG